MLHKIMGFGLSLVLMFGLQSGAAQAQFNSDDWPASSFVKPLPGKAKDGKPVSEDKSASVEALQGFMKNGTFLSPGDVTHFSKNLEGLVGNYFVFKKDGSIQLSGATLVAETKNIDIEDGIIFSAIVDYKIKAGAKSLPFLDVDMTKDDRAELTIQSVVTVHGSNNVDKATCNIPLRFLGKKNEEIYFITAATVTMIKKRVFKKREQKGTALVSILSLNGTNYYSSDVIQRVPVISVQPIQVSPIDPAYKHLCAKYNDAYKAIQVAGIKKKSKYSAVRALRILRLSKEQQALNEAKAQLAKVIQKSDVRSMQNTSGRVLRVSR